MFPFAAIVCNIPGHVVYTLLRDTHWLLGATKMLATFAADIVGNCTASQGRQVAEGFQDIVEYLHSKLPSTHIVIMAILPKVQVISQSISSDATPCSVAVLGAAF